MAAIQCMPLRLANKIAAGEVVQRPASAVKELVENAIDAGATKIEVSVKGAGTGLIQVRDNGSGMGPEDAELCFQRHATSKISAPEDLDDIRTLGFRGEALAAISAIAQVTLRTRRKEDEHGTAVRIDGGRPVSVEPCAVPQGTSIEVQNLFYNVPARRNFLKAPRTEMRHLAESVQAQAMASPWTHFVMRSEDQTLWQYPGAQPEEFMEALQKRLEMVLGPEQARQLVPIDERTGYLSMVGYVGRPEHARKVRRDQYLYVNGRPIRDASIRHAVTSAYFTLLEEGLHPSFVLFLSVPPRYVDVNVHPAKAEVRFDDGRGVYNFTQSVVRQSLALADLIPQYSEGLPDIRVQSSNPAPWSAPQSRGALKEAYGSQAAIRYTPEQSSVPPGGSPQDMPLLWQLHDQYIMTHLRKGLMILDQQAAHERILYERAKEDLRTGVGLCQQVLFPVYITLDRSDYELLQSLKQQMTALGFNVRLAPGCRVQIMGLPSDVGNGAEKELVREVLEQYKTNEEELQLETSENLARSIARCGAIRPGLKLNSDEMRTLVDRLFQCSKPFVAPDGRPTLFEISLEELQLRFARPVHANESDEPS
ncbi:MAG: DNA mismatch repair endonuclease MutL [Bacteroidota bacterium]|nr:DNA mismatch repair endonuclease MutL [Bacteroidota bacterium]MDE2834584.1 DNA mismatch repair endonuclease MutL [Bacteroidota bacterium]MDE2956283.1 DNA mismatch repair endonuclease MutL [Bacteroidota bacterium]